MTSRSYRVDSNTVEVVPVRVVTVADPTAGAVEFAFTQSAEPTSWTAGSWGTWTAATSLAIALSPTLPAAGATVTLAEGRWTIWCRFTVGGETVVESPGELVVA